MIFNREETILDVIKNQSENISGIKQAQIIGYDNLVVTHHVAEYESAATIAQGVYAEYTATFTYENPPSDALVVMTFDYSFAGTNAIFSTEYTPAAFIESNLVRKFILRITSISGTITSQYVASHVNTTEKGVLTVERTL